MPRSLKCAAFAILVAAGQVVAQTSDAVCGSISFTWEVNSKGQSPCIVASTIISYTQNSPFNLWALQSQPARYPGPVQTDEAHWGFNRAVCSMVTYSLLAGCAYCQGSSWPSWPEQIQHCNSTYLGNDQGAIKGLPIDVPSITAVPSWAEFDYSSLTGQTWDPVRAQLISQQAAGNGTNTGTDNSGNGGGKKKSSIAGPVAGGVVGGVAVILAVIGAFWWRRRRLAKRRQSDMQDLSSEKNASDNGKVPAPTPSTIAYQQSYFPASEPPSPPVHGVHNEDMRYYLSSTPQSSSDGGRVVTSLYPSQVLHRSAVPELQSSPEVDEPDTYDSFRRSG